MSSALTLPAVTLLALVYQASPVSAYLYGYYGYGNGFQGSYIAAIVVPVVILLFFLLFYWFWGRHYMRRRRGRLSGLNNDPNVISGMPMSQSGFGGGGYSQPTYAGGEQYGNTSPSYPQQPQQAYQGGTGNYAPPQTSYPQGYNEQGYTNYQGGQGQREFEPPAGPPPSGKEERGGKVV